MASHAAMLSMRSGRIWLCCGVSLALLLLAGPAQAALDNMALLDTVVSKFSVKATAWQDVMMKAATWLFWTLGTISLAWTGGMMVLRKADIGEFFAEFIRFILFFGFFLWLLRNGPAFASSIIASMQQLGASAAGQQSITPSAIIDIGFKIWQQSVTKISVWAPVESLVGMLLSAGILLLLAAVAVNMLLLLVSGWILMYAGIFFLGFGGSRWTSDMAINYYKSVLGVGVQLMTMVLLVGIGNDLLKGYYEQFNKAENNLNEMVVLLVFCLVLLMLASKLPAMVAGLVTGGASNDIGSFGAGAVMGAAMGAAGAATAAAGMAGAAVRSGAAHGAGGAQALMAAYTRAAGGGATGAMADIAGKLDNKGSSAFADMDSGRTVDSGTADSSSSTRNDDRSASGSEHSADSEEGGRGGGSPSVSSASSGSAASGGNDSADRSGSGQSAGSDGTRSMDAGTTREGAGAELSGGQATGSGQPGAGSADVSGIDQRGHTGFGRALATATGTAGFLAQGSLAVGKEKMARLRSQARERMDATLGARVASAIDRSGALPTGSRAGDRTQRASEVAAFVQGDSSKG
ncbi:P-type conjugative transfer protein TrbL [Comamonas endophytica]|uniref:P-type conjugative transfer protein TrbL n=1 Tax=Comamonas endophytica TaxID=2949090 RepID=A0ABY6GF23_9BURK|nr:MULTISPECIES: P-type conjugative transfer protein TrbL [unclassified Acidovorax]MCD2514400.1 P-type conjugative transfer protein TrbL [Acidovorax sp. D4N7]UYG53690.1 P-type conjugative transfer protein TrbL [Acidovorax sp. 5MLIR]